ncbi:MAG: AraC family transcriptional regulator [Verrucomicrobiales bacterium]|nr:AraC family transcriptional regulator [Verrucomicrobiales bacterium]
MKNFRPLLLEDLQVDSSGLQVLRLCVNQHLPEAEWVNRHRHDFCQCLLYLTGHGVQRLAGKSHAVRAGSLIYVPDGVTHSFEKQGERTPLCMVVDFQVEDRAELQAGLSSLHTEDIAVLRQRLSWLMTATEQRGGVALKAREAAMVLDVTGILLAAVTGEGRGRASTPLSDKVRDWIRDGDLQTMSLASLVEQSGIQKDHLNRVLKRECGLTLGQLLAEYRLQQAKQALADAHLLIQEVGSEVGFEDSNYFARWFRQQTGYSPRTWRQREGLG